MGPSQQGMGTTGQVMEFIIESGLFLEGVIIHEKEHLVVVKDREGRHWQGHPSKILYKSGQRQNVAPLKEAVNPGKLEE